jgi:hypothetical protein
MMEILSVEKLNNKANKVYKVQKNKRYFIKKNSFEDIQSKTFLKMQ